MAIDTVFETARRNRKAAVAFLARRKGQEPRRARPAPVESGRMILFRDVMVMLITCQDERGAGGHPFAGRGSTAAGSVAHA